jgi:Holliday junction resolvase
MRRNAKVDSNQKSIVQTLRKAGCRVLSLAAVGQGCPDLLVSRACTLYLLEVKDGSLPPSAGRNRLSKQQVAFHKLWTVSVVCSESEALEAVGL